ncbi:MAG: transglycosylase family protein [Solirubrobacteraceae bacterium]
MIDTKRRRGWGARTALLGTAATAAVLAIAVGASASNVSKLKSQLGATRSELNSNRARQQGIAASISSLNQQVNALSSQVSLVQGREAAARDRLAQENAQLGDARAAVAAERVKLKALRKFLKRARRALAEVLVNQYEQPQQSLVTVVINAKGFQQLLDQLDYISSVSQHERTVVLTTRRAERQNLAAARRLVKLESADESAAQVATTQTDALAGMTALLGSREAALADERSAKDAALSATQASGASLTAALSTIKHKEAAAAAAAAAINKPPSAPASTRSSANPSAPASTRSPANPSTPASTTSPASPSPASGTGTTDAPGTSSVPGTSGGSGVPSGSGSTGSSQQSSGGWAIPYAIVLCESGGQNLPPNSAGASGYYQIIPSTWKSEGGTGPAAYLASKAEQSYVAAKLWAGGAGASNWTCSKIVGIS